MLTSVSISSITSACLSLSDHKSWSPRPRTCCRGRCLSCHSPPPAAIPRPQKRRRTLSLLLQRKQPPTKIMILSHLPMLPTAKTQAMFRVIVMPFPFAHILHGIFSGTSALIWSVRTCLYLCLCLCMGLSVNLRLKLCASRGFRTSLRFLSLLRSQLLLLSRMGIRPRKPGGPPRLHVLRCHRRLRVWLWLCLRLPWWLRRSPALSLAATSTSACACAGDSPLR
jgi:hypothetical protein